MTLLLLLLSISPATQPIVQLREHGPFRRDTSVMDDGRRISYFSATIRDRDGREWVGYGMDRDEAAVNATRHYRDWANQQ